MPFINTLFSCLALAKNLPSEEKLQQITLLLLERQELISLKVKPINKRTCYLMLIENKKKNKISPLEAAGLGSAGLINLGAAELPLASPSSLDKID